MKNPIDKVINPNTNLEMTTAEAAAYIRKSESTLKTWRCTKEQQIPFYRSGRNIYYRKADLDDWLESQRVAA